MNENSNIVPLRQPDEIDDPLTNILRSGARQLLAQAVEMEAEAFLNQTFDEKAPGALQTWVERSEGSFIELMYNMSKALGYDFDRVQLKRGAYYTRGQVEADQAQRALQQSLAKVLTGEQPIGMNVVGLPVDKQAAELQTAVQKQYLKALTGEGALYVATKNDKRLK
jgi:hypothetical protein